MCKPYFMCLIDYNCRIKLYYLLKPTDEKKVKCVRYVYYFMAALCTLTQIINPIIILLTPTDGKRDLVQQDYVQNTSYYIRNSLTTSATICYSIYNIIFTIKLVKEMQKNTQIEDDFVICRVIGFSVFIEILICGRVVIIWTINRVYFMEN